MRGGTFSYLSKQGLSSLSKNKLMTFASVGVLSACLFLISIALLLSFNLNNIIKYVEEQNEIVIFLDDLSEDDMKKADEEIRAIQGVNSVKFVSKDEALMEQAEDLGEAILEGLKSDNPLPDSYRITISAYSDLNLTIETLKGIEGVIQVNAPSGLAETLASIRQTVLVISISIVAALILVTMVVIGNTIKLTVFARKLEINIMKQVGARNNFIRFPFIIEGGTLGLLAATTSILFSFISYQAVLTLASKESASWMSAVSNNLIPIADLWWIIVLVNITIGVITGILSTVISIKKHLKV